MSTKNTNIPNQQPNSQEPVNQPPSGQKPDQHSGLTTNQKIMIGGFTGLIAVIVAAAVIVVSILNKPEPAPPLPTGGNLIINEDNLAAIEKEIKTKVQDGMFMTDMNIDWSFPNGKSVSPDAYVGNMRNNHRPLSFEIIRSDTKEVIYTSDVIPPGYSIKEIKLDTDLPAGTYPMVCVYHLLDEETGATVSTLSINITVRILN